MVVVVMMIMLVSSVVLVAGDPAKDREDCAEELVGLATCLPYVGGKARAPTPDCCTGLKTLMKNNKKCLCVIVRDRDDPDLGLQINVTLALSLPSLCRSPANVSKCPELLKMDPKSAEAQVFYQLESGGGSNHTTAAASPAPAHTGHAAGGGPTSANDKNGSAKRELGWDVVVITAFLALNFWLVKWVG